MCGSASAATADIGVTGPMIDDVKTVFARIHHIDACGPNGHHKAYGKDRDENEANARHGFI
jgi:hypothetical protein